MALTAAIVMIVSYETLRTLTVYLARCPIGLMLCDEGHRLKNSGRYFNTLDLHLSLTRTQTLKPFKR